MLIKFNISNFRSFAREGNLNLITAPGYKSDLPEQIFSDGRRELLNTCVVYGPNSAGKSNLFLAMDLMKHFVLNSQTFQCEFFLIYLYPQLSAQFQVQLN